MLLGDGSLLVYDRLDAHGRHHYVQTWPLDPRLDVTRRPDGILAAARDGRPSFVLALAPAGAGVDLARGEDEPPAGWWSRRLEQVEPAWSARVTRETEGGAEFAALLVPVDEGAVADPLLRLETDGRTARISFCTPAGAHEVDLDLDDAHAPVVVSRGVAAATEGRS